MKPIKIIMSAFGSYADYTEIDFTQFADKGLFLITGQTGAGKTTIFDAICFALYGKASGEYRDETMLRNENALPSVQTYVEFLFTHQGKEYRIRRNPKYEREKERGSGTTLEKAGAELYENDKPIASGPDKVGKAILDLLNVSEAQFKQIVMIAQGEFRKVLNASTPERTKILRTIFSTEGYDRIGGLLKDRCSASKKKLDTIENSIIQYVNGVRIIDDDITEAVSEFNELAARASASGSAWNAEEITTAISKIIQEDTELLTEANNKLIEAKTKEDDVSSKIATAEINNSFLDALDNLEKEAAELESERAVIDPLRALTDKRRKANRIVMPAYNQWCKTKSEKTRIEEEIRLGEEALEQLKQRAAAAADKLKEEEQRKPDADKFTRLADAISEDERNYQRRDELIEELKSIYAKQKVLLDQAEKFQEKAKALEGRIVSLRNLIEELRNKPEELRQAKDRLKEFENLVEKLESILGDKAEDIRSKQKALESLTSKARGAEEKYSESRKARDAAEQLFTRSIAGRMAEGLEEGKPCPVCGSIHHPDLAVILDESVTETMLEAMKKQEEEDRTAKETAVVAAEKGASELEMAEQHLRNDILECLHLTEDDSDLKDLLDRASEEKDKAQKSADSETEMVDVLTQDCTKLGNAEIDLAKASGEETDSLKNENDQMQKESEDLAIALTAASTELKGLERLEYKDWQTASEARAEYQKKAESIINSFNSASSAKQNADLAVTDKESSIRTNNEALIRTSAAAESEKTELEALCSENGFASVEEMLTYRAEALTIEEDEKRITDYEQRLATNRARLKQARSDAEGRERADVDQMKLDLNECRTVTDQVSDTVTSIRFRIDANNDICSKIAELTPMLKEQRTDYTRNTRLYMLVSGQTRSTKLTLEQYVQIAGFERIIDAANRRMYPLSRRQYRLKRKEDGLGTKSMKYLDLDVVNLSNGKRRPAGNLSGGESFLASLSLALGLSDTISSDLGGVQMDALFIDEGFGSLDSELLESTLDVLLQQSGPNKLIGIISHREELGDIPQKIKVSRDAGGSHVEIELES